MCTMQSDVSSELGVIHAVRWKVMSRFMGEVHEHMLMGHKPQVEQRGMNKSSYMFNNLSNMLPSAHQIQMIIAQALGDKSNLWLPRAPWQIHELLNTTIVIAYAVCTDWLGFAAYAADVCPLQTYGWNRDNRPLASLNKHANIAKFREASTQM